MINSLSLKFGIGVIAGLCAALFPRLVAELALSSDNNVVHLFSQNYLVLSIVFAVLIGAVITILEWESTRSPKDIFMSALAIPAILSGALNTTASVKDFAKVEAEKNAYEKTLEQDFAIPTLEPTQLTPLSQSAPSRTANPLSLLFIGTAQASNEELQLVGNNNWIGIRITEQAFVVVLAVAISYDEAKDKADSLRNKIPVKIFRASNNRFYITTVKSPQDKSSALLEAVQIKKTTGLSPSLMEAIR